MCSIFKDGKNPEPNFCINQYSSLKMIKPDKIFL